MISGINCAIQTTWKLFSLKQCIYFLLNFWCCVGQQNYIGFNYTVQLYNALFACCLVHSPPKVLSPSITILSLCTFLHLLPLPLHSGDRRAAVYVHEVLLFFPLFFFFWLSIVSPFLHQFLKKSSLLLLQPSLSLSDHGLVQKAPLNFLPPCLQMTEMYTHIFLLTF